MSFYGQVVRVVLPALIAWLGMVGSPVRGEDPKEQDTDPVEARQSLNLAPLVGLTASEQTHPIVPALRMAQDGLDRIHRDVRDYSCRLVARERINGILQSHEYMRLKIRHPWQKDGGKSHPFGVYLRYLGPKRIEGREVLYVREGDDSEMLVRNGGTGSLQDVTLSMRPDATRAMSSHRYPVTHIGMVSMLTRLLNVGREAIAADTKRECRVRFIEGATIDQRACTCVEVRFPVRRDKVPFHLARIFVDDVTQLPVRYASYSWPARKGSPPPLQEEYTYLEVKTNVGLTDRDFDRNNPDYRFYRPKDEK